ncbi:hypothetical protein TYRP_013783 [Tyrophagus putrescentiae]|nr:hypothetical protein TYRP_013783 [Tyrophagus putrescentiae]
MTFHRKPSACMSHLNGNAAANSATAGYQGFLGGGGGHHLGHHHQHNVHQQHSALTTAAAHLRHGHHAHWRRPRW